MPHGRQVRYGSRLRGAITCKCGGWCCIGDRRWGRLHHRLFEGHWWLPIGGDRCRIRHRASWLPRRLKLYWRRAVLNRRLSSGFKLHRRLLLSELRLRCPVRGHWCLLHVLRRHCLRLGEASWRLRWHRTLNRALHFLHGAILLAVEDIVGSGHIVK